MRKKYLLPLILIVAALPSLACGAVGVIDPAATQTAMEGTVVSLQATISALEQKVAAPTDTPTVTATPIPAITPKSGAVAASSLGQTLPTSTTTPTPIQIQPQDTVVVLVATFTPTPTPKLYSDAPVILEPRDGTVVEEQKEILLRWSWNGILGPGEYYDIKIRPDGQTRSAYVAWERGTGHNLRANLAPGRYYWSVQIVKGSYKNNSGEPEDRVFETFLSPESEPRLLIVAKKSSDKKRKTSTPTPTVSTSESDEGGSEAVQPDDEPTVEPSPEAAATTTAE